MSMCRVFSYIVGRGCLLLPVCSLGKTLLSFSLLHSVLQFYIIPIDRGVIQSREKGGKKELGMKFREIQGEDERQKDF